MPLPTTNATISILRVSGANTRTFSSVATGVVVYMNQIDEDLVQSFDGQWAFYAYRMMTDGSHTAIVVGDRVNDGTYTYDVRGAKKHRSLVGDSHQYILTRPA